jgi:hypothetical protein
MNKVVSTILFVVILGSSCFLSWNRLTEGHVWDGDFAEYVMQGESVWQGKISAFLQRNRFAMEESTYQVGPVAYPWGFPVLLAPFYAFLGLNMLALRGLNILFYAIFLISLWFGFRRYHSRFWLFILICVFAFNPYFLQVMNGIMSDVAFLVLSTFSIVFIGRVVIQRHRVVSNITDQVLLGALIAISFFFRSQGILLLAALGIAQIIAAKKSNIIEQRRSSRAIAEPGDSLLRQFFLRASNLWILILPYIFFLIATLLWRSILPEGGSSHLSFCMKYHYTY